MKSIARKIYRKLTYPPYRPIMLFSIAFVLFMLPIGVFAAPLMQELPPDPETAEFTQVLIYAVTFLVGLLGTGLTQFIKDKLGIETKWALLLTYAVSFVLALAQLAVLGWFDPVLFTGENLPVIFTTLFTSATFWYQFLVKPRVEAKG